MAAAERYRVAPLVGTLVVLVGSLLQHVTHGAWLVLGSTLVIGAGLGVLVWARRHHHA